MGVHQLKLQREIKYMKASILQNFSPCFPASFLLFNFLPLNQIFLLLPLWHQAPKRVARCLHSTITSVIIGGVPIIITDICRFYFLLSCTTLLGSIPSYHISVICRKWILKN